MGSHMTDVVYIEPKNNRWAGNVLADNCVHYAYKKVRSLPVMCQTTGPKPLPKRFLHIVRSRTSSFNWQYPVLSLRSSSSFLRLLPRLLATSICPFIFPSITCCRRQFLRKMCFTLTKYTAGPSGRSPAEIVGSSPTGDMDVCLLWMLCVVR